MTKLKAIQITMLPEMPEDELYRRAVETFARTIALAFGVPAYLLYPPRREFSLEDLEKALEDLNGDS